jgi:hypothetical protein
MAGYSLGSLSQALVSGTKSTGVNKQMLEEICGEVWMDGSRCLKCIDCFTLKKVYIVFMYILSLSVYVLYILYY